MELAASPAADAKLLALEQIEDVKAFLDALRGERHNEAVRLLCNLSYIPVDLGRVSTCAREVEALDESIRTKMSDILLAASDALQRAYAAAVAAAGGGQLGTMSPMSAQSEHVRRLSDRIAALAAFAGQSRLNMPQAIYSNLARGSAAF